MFPIGRRCARPERPRPARRLARRASRFSLPALASLSLGVASLAGAQQNLGFETLDGWSVAGGSAEIASGVDAAEGERSLELERAEPGVTRVTQRIPAALLRAAGDAPLAARLKLTGLARQADTGLSGALWLRIDGERGPLFLDSGGYAREPGEPLAASPESADRGTQWRRFEVELPFASDVDEVAFGVIVRGEGTAWFDALELRVVAVDSQPAASPAATQYLDAALALMREHSLRRAEIDWPALRAQALEHARGAITDADAHLAVRFALRELGDRHSYLQSAAATRALAATAVANARTGSPLTPPRARPLGANLAYVSVPGFAGGTPAQQVEFAEALSNEIRANDGARVCGWVVDLRQNTGGNLWPMLAGLGPLLGDGELAASVYPDGRRVAVWHRDGQAGFGDFTQLRVRAPYRVERAVPAAVLLGPATASSAEILAVALHGRPATRSFGAPTRGLIAGNRIFTLRDGASLVLTVAATSDGSGSVYAGPIVPDEVVPGGAAEEAGDATLAAAVTWLLAGDSCR
jgi:peptidase S41-like protein